MSDLASFDALAEITEATDGLTASEMRSIATFARSVRARRRTTTPIGREVVEASDWRDDLLPLLRHVLALLDGADTLAEVAALTEQDAQFAEQDPETEVAGPYLRELATSTFAVAEGIAAVDPSELRRMISGLASTCPELPVSSADAPT